MKVTQAQPHTTYSFRALLALFFVVFFFKCMVLFYLAYLAKCGSNSTVGFFFQIAGDTKGYLGSVENFITTGKYFVSNGLRDVYAARMPYYGSVYYLLRMAFPLNTAYDLLIVLQIAVDALAVIYLGLIGKILFKTSSSFWLTIILSTISLNVAYWSLSLLPESFSVSFLIFFIYYYLRHRETNDRKHLLLSGVWLACLILLKPYFLPLIGFLFLDILTKGFSSLGLDWANAIKRTLLFGLVLLVFLSPWIIRNYFLLNKFIPLQESTYAEYVYTESDLSCRRFIQAWGGNAGVYWEKKSAACYFMLHPTTPCEFVFPDYVSTSGYTMKEIETVKDNYIKLQLNYNDSLDLQVTNEFNRLTTIFIKEKPFRYYVLSPLIIARNFIFHSGSYYLPISAGFKCYHSYQLPIKLSQTLLYYLTLFFGLAGLMLLFLANRSTLLLLAIPVYIIVFFCFYFKAGEFRYFIHSYPVLILGTVYCFELIKNRMATKKLTRNNA